MKSWWNARKQYQYKRLEEEDPKYPNCIRCSICGKDNKGFEDVSKEKQNEKK